MWAISESKKKKKVSREEGHRFTPQNVSSLLVKVKSNVCQKPHWAIFQIQVPQGQNGAQRALTSAVALGLWKGGIDLYRCFVGA